MSRPSIEPRRRFLKTFTLGLGGVVATIIGYPFIRFFAFPLKNHGDAAPRSESDVGASHEFKKNDPFKRVRLKVASSRDAWASESNKEVGSAWIARGEDGTLRAFSSACPHLGCSVRFDASHKNFQCPCHNSAFTEEGKPIHGPAKRGLDPLPVAETEGRVRVTFLRFQSDTKERRPA